MTTDKKLSISEENFMSVNIEIFDFGVSQKSKNNCELRGRHRTGTVSRKIFSPRDRDRVPKNFQSPGPSAIYTFFNRIIHNHKIGWKKNSEIFSDILLKCFELVSKYFWIANRVKLTSNERSACDHSLSGKIINDNQFFWSGT